MATVKNDPALSVASKTTNLNDFIQKLNEKLMSPSDLNALAESIDKKILIELFDKISQESTTPKQNNHSVQHALCKAYYNLGQFCEFEWVQREYVINDDHALYCYRTSAASGFRDAQNKVGELFFRYHKRAEAQQWFLLAEAQGLIEASYNLGRLRRGDDIRFPENGVESFEKAAIQGHCNAQYWLARTLQDNWNHVNADEALKKQWRIKAFHWYKAASEQNHPEALSQLGWFYEHNILPSPSLNAEQRLTLAMDYYKRAAVLGSASGTIRLAQCHKRMLQQFTQVSKQNMQGNGSANTARVASDRKQSSELANITPTQVFEVLTNTLKKLNEINDHGPYDPRGEAEFTLGECFLDGFGIPSNLEQKARMEKGLALLTNAVSRERAHAGAAFRLAKYHEARMTELKDEKELADAAQLAFRFCRQAAESGHSEAAYTLYLYCERSLVPDHAPVPDFSGDFALVYTYRKPEVCLRSAFEIRSALERAHLPTSPLESEFWLERAACQGHAEALVFYITLLRDLWNMFDPPIHSRVFQKMYELCRTAKQQGIVIPEPVLSYCLEHFDMRISRNEAFQECLSDTLRKDFVVPLLEFFKKIVEERAVFKSFEQQIIRSQDGKETADLSTAQVHKQSREKKQSGEKKVALELRTAYEWQEYLIEKIVLAFKPLFDQDIRGKIESPMLAFLNDDTIRRDMLPELEYHARCALQNVLSCELDNKLRFEALLQGFHPRLGQSAACHVKKLMDPNLFHPKCLHFVYQLMGGIAQCEGLLPKPGNLDALIAAAVPKKEASGEDDAATDNDADTAVASAPAST